MSPSPDSLLPFWRSEWERVLIQLDEFNCVIRISFDVYWRLGNGGRDYFIRQASVLLDKPAEFFIDNSNATRVLLVNRWDLQAVIPCQLEPWTANGLPRFFPKLPSQQHITNTPENSTPGTYYVTNTNTSPSNVFTPPGSSASGNSIQLNTPLSDTQINNVTQQTTPVSQTPTNSVGYTQTPGVGYPAAFGAPGYMPQQSAYTPFPQMNMPMGQSVAVNSQPISSLKRKSTAESNPQGQAQEEASGSTSKRRKKEHPARPPNAYILFRSYWHNQTVADNPGISNADVSRKITKRWEEMTELEKDLWHEQADNLALEHARLYPDAKYTINIKAIQKKQNARAARAAAAKAEAEAAAREQQQQPEQSQPEQQQAQQQSEVQNQQGNHVEQVEAQQVQVESVQELPEQVGPHEQPSGQPELPQELLEPIEFPENLQQQAEIWEKKAAEGEDISFFDILGGVDFMEEFTF
ncbi:hypothetical protein EKO27_g8276 [Xylaria grammica]|uniref:HMG box domain-containing protein n=1 Tax=Xylaria grammica TaxID=363999 RepID=A0A439CXU0_9PEZI|nr:hypothetical protein EKO27_g8276 [Xylaria grammica]